MFKIDGKRKKKNRKKGRNTKNKSKIGFMMNIGCIFHDIDLDGWMSSAIIKRKHKNDKITFYPFNYQPNYDFSKIKNYDIVYLVDCSPNDPDVMNTLMENNKKIVWIDHHARKIWDIYNKLGKEIDGIRDTENNNSACVLTWKYLYPDEQVPLILTFVEDMDLWRWKHEDTDAINTVLFIDYMKDRNKLINIIERGDDIKKSYLKYVSLKDKGNTYIKMRENQISFLLETMYTKNFHGHETGIVNSPIHTSYVGHEILNKNPKLELAMIWYYFNDRIVVSLRSRGDTDVSEIATKYGGGGHKAASGFSLDPKNKKNRNVYL